MSNYALTPEVAAIGRMAFRGNVTPDSWYQELRLDSDKPYLAAIVILAEIVYWYRPSEIRDESTGQVTGLKKKFKADKLQRNYQALVNKFGFTKRQVANACHYLQEKGLIDLDFRTILIGEVVASNVLFIGINSDRIEEITFVDSGDTYHLSKLEGSLSEVRTGALKRETNTKTTPEITSEITSDTDQYPLNPPKQINQEGGEEAIRIEVEILKEDQKPASIPSDQKPSPLTALTIGDDQKRSAAAPIAAQQEIQVSPNEVISGAQRTDDRFNRKLHSWQQTTNEGRVQIDSKFIEYVASLMPRGKMHPTPMARNHVINEQKTESGLMKIQGYWDDWQAIQTGVADLSHHLSEADRKFLDRYNSMNVLAAKYGGSDA